MHSSTIYDLKVYASVEFSKTVEINVIFIVQLYSQSNLEANVDTDSS